MFRIICRFRKIGEWDAFILMGAVDIPDYKDRAGKLRCMKHDPVHCLYTGRLVAFIVMGHIEKS